MKKKKFTKRQIVEAFVTFIMANGPISHTALEARAQSKSWYTMEAFDRIMETIHRHPQITSSVRKDDVYYFKRKVRPKKAPEPIKRPDYPEPDEMMGIHPIFEEYDKSCNCTLHASRDEIIEFRKRGEHARLCNLNPTQAHRIKNLYNKYYGREQDPDENNQASPVQGSLLLAQ
ncbi:MAG: hypothetical protein Tp172MES00d2C118482111_18 [Prokaryotic dsDNA virus sp.]|nr:MAG: hypothetical protein Tp172MES00d2C118482111_18 [Prokaryotic dsDNA virus sp.]|tara:strand:- start:2870 stop:3391 length:522 start_codon:yes stop_codon:yes gene_type:complete